MIQSEKATWPEIKTAIEQNRVAILPFGAHEEHGPHCPLSTDTVMANGLATRLAEQVDGILLPPIPYGETWNTSGFPGTLSLSFSTVKAILMDLGVGLMKSGVKALIVVNGHFGNRAPIELACRELKVKYDFPVLLIDYPGLERLASEICESQPAAPSFYHADELETSVMLALMPDAVQMDKAQAEYPDFPPTFASEPIYLHTFCKSGVFGDPRPATAEKGEKLLDGLTQESMKVVTAFLTKL